MLFFTTEFWYSFRAVTQVILSMSMLLAGYIYCNDYYRLQKLIKSFLWIIPLGVVATTLGYVFGIGKLLEYTATEEFGGGEKVGLLGSAGLYGPAIGLGLLPIILKKRLYPFKRWLFLSLCVILFIFILLNVRRTAILIPIAGLLSFLLFSEARFKTFRILLLAAVVLSLSFPLYSGLLEKRFKVREEEGRFEKSFYKTEDRYSENIEMLKSIYNFKEPVKVLFGIGNNIFAEHIKEGKTTGRMYHSDSARLFYGEGILGLILYFLVYVQILYKIIRIPKTAYLSDIKAGAMSLWFISVFVSLNGSIVLITFRSINFLLLGAFIGVAYSRVNRNQFETQTEIPSI